ncbi:MAG TPA: hypothetical protein VNV14_08490 [Opitutaceae bacterium]|jgi:hypothetical protein|nr:hypothetical protein [Opitutaceae bacterium]
MHIDALTPDKKDTMAALLSQGFQEISILSKRGKLEEAKSFASVLAPILINVQDPDFDLESTTTNFARSKGHPPSKERASWCRAWTGFVSGLKPGRTSFAA